MANSQLYNADKIMVADLGGYRMSLADDVQALRNQRRTIICKTGAWLASLEDDDRNAFVSYVADGGVLSTMWRTAVRHGCEAAETRFRAHCRKQCSCYNGAEIAA